MNIKSLIFSVVETIIKVVVLALAVMFILKGITKAYDFGYKVFADEPMSINNPKTITIAIADGATDAEKVGAMLEEKGLIEDAKLFRIQELLSAYHGRILPGIYDLSTGMTANEMLQVMSSGSSVIDDESSGYSGAENFGDSEGYSESDDFGEEYEETIHEEGILDEDTQ